MGLLVAAPVCIYAALAGGPIDGDSLFLMLFAPFSVWLGVRCLRVCVVADSNSLVARNFFSTRTVTQDRIAAIDLAMKSSGEGGYVRMPQVRLIDGSTFWISALECGNAKKSPRPDRLSMLHELRSILRVSGADV